MTYTREFFLLPEEIQNLNKIQNPKEFIFKGQALDIIKKLPHKELCKLFKFKTEEKTHPQGSKTFITKLILKD